MELLDFRSNLNPEGPPPWLPEARQAADDSVAARKAPGRQDFRRAADACSRRFDFSPDCFVFGEGANDLLTALPRALGVEACLALPPMYSGIRRAADLAGVPLYLHPAREEDGYTLRPGSLRLDMARTQGRALIYLGRPNNPVGIPLPVESVLEAARAFPGHYLCVDESFVELADQVEPVLSRGRRIPDNLIVLRSLTKALAVPGLRLGFLGAAAVLARRIAAGLNARPANPLAGEVAARAVSDPGFFAESAARIAGYRGRFDERLARIPGIRPEPGFANFILLRVDGRDARGTAEAARRLGVDFRDYLPGEYPDGTRWLRTSVRRDEDNETATAALENAVRGTRAGS